MSGKDLVSQREREIAEQQATVAKADRIYAALPVVANLVKCLQAMGLADEEISRMLRHASEGLTKAGAGRPQV